MPVSEPLQDQSPERERGGDPLAPASDPSGDVTTDAASGLSADTAAPADAAAAPADAAAAAPADAAAAPADAAAAPADAAAAAPADADAAPADTDADATPAPAPAPTSALPSATAQDLLRRTTTPIRIALALIYFHFGFLKFFPDLSAAEMLSTQTIIRLRMGFDAHTALVVLACFEVAIGLLFVTRVSMRWVFPIFLAHMAGTLLPLVLLPELTFKFAPFAPTLEGQYIIKNAVVIAAGWTLYRAETIRPAAPLPEAGSASA